MCQKSSRSLKPFGHNTPTLQTDGRISYGIGLDLTVGQKRMISGIVKIRYPQHKSVGLTTVLSADVRSSKLHTASTRGVQTSADAGKVIQNTYV